MRLQLIWQSSRRTSSPKLKPSLSCESKPGRTQQLPLVARIKKSKKLKKKKNFSSKTHKDLGQSPSSKVKICTNINTANYKVCPYLHVPMEQAISTLAPTAITMSLARLVPQISTLNQASNPSTRSRLRALTYSLTTNEAD